ncbi:MAG: hypothetical protein ORO03_00240, partial [Alphaproteobacteria bacterium]|nr:hypothetical protein [Alphaproteobacteria bacterium]
TTATVLDNNTVLAATYGGAAGSRTIAGLSVTGSNDSAIQGLSAIYGGTVEIQGITTGSVRHLRSIEATGIAFTTGASSFNGPLSLVANGDGIDIDSTVAGVLIKANLSTSNGGDLSVVQKGSTTGNGILILSSILNAAGAMTLTQSGRAVLDGIVINRSNLLAGGNLSLLQTGTVGSTYNGIKLTAPGIAANQLVALAAGRNSFVTLKTNGQKLSLNQTDNFAVTRGKLRIDLGAGTMVSSTPASPYTLNASGLEVYYTSAISGNSAKISVGSGSFTFVNDKRSVTGDMNMNDSSSVPEWGTGLGTLTSGTATGGLTVTTTGTDAKINNQGVVYGGTVMIHGVGGIGAVNNLRYIEGTGVRVTTARTFSGNLTLVGNGAGITTGNTTAGVLITANLTTSNGGDLSLVQNGATSGTGINVDGVTLTAGGAMTLTQSGSAGRDGITVLVSTLTAGGALSLVQSGSAELEGIAVGGSSLTAGGELWLQQSGTVGSDIGGINLYAYGTAANQAVNLAAGTGQFVTLKTNNQKLSLNNNDNFVVTSGKVRIDLGTGAMTSSGNNSLKADGLDVYYSGATTGNSAKIAVGSGSFSFVNDRRSVTSAVTLANSTTASDATNGWGTGPTFGVSGSDTTLGGLTITGTGGATRLQGLGVAYGGTVDIQGVVSGAARSLRYIEGNSITVSGAASTFTGDLLLRSLGSSSLSLGANLTTGGRLGINASGLSLTSNVTTDGGAVAINLGWGVYNNGTGTSFVLDTSGQSLSVTAGSITNTSANSRIFKLGTGGVLTLGGGLALAATTITGGATNYSGSVIDEASKYTAFNAAGVKY